MKRRILFICHNHPGVRPGGAEAYAYELHLSLSASSGYESIFLAKGGPPLGQTGAVHSGTFFEPTGHGDNEYFFYTDGYQFDHLMGTHPGKDFYHKHFRDFLQAYEPDIVHFQHTLFLGYDMIREVRNTLPHVPILYTLHEYLPICHRDGQMLRTGTEELCNRASPRRCHECFPAISPQTFFLRDRFVKSHFSLVDLFLAPSDLLRQRYIEWGIPKEKIRKEEYGRRPAVRTAPVTERPVRNRFAFFGQLSPYKGIDVLLEAMRIIAQESETPDSRRGKPSQKTTLRVHGANLDFQPGQFQNRFTALLAELQASVTFVGKYSHDSLPDLMEHVDWVVVPSVWWENSPLVIQEAFLHGRPVICSDIGGMAEKVVDNVNGLHFKVGDPLSLAATLKTAANTRGLWQRLREGIPDIYKMEDHITLLDQIYRAQLDLKSEEAGTRVR